MAITYPSDCDTSAKKTEWLYRAQELLRKLHNVFGRWLREGISQTKYDKLPQKIKSKYPYVPQLSQSDWRKFCNEDFEPRSTKICAKINENRALLFQSTQWIVKVEDI